MKNDKEDRRNNGYFKEYKKIRKFDTGVEKQHQLDNNYKRVKINPAKFDWKNIDDIEDLNEIYG
jgi:ABC-type tungstate transport system permease subunit